MKLLFISPLLDGTGYSQAGIDYALSMDCVGIDVVGRPIKLNQQKNPIPTRITELIDKSSDNCDICLQHCLPSMFEFNGNYHNIGMFAWETDSWPKSIWTEKCNLMDEIWVINQHMRQVAINQGVKVPISVIPHATNIDKYKQYYDSILPTSNNFVFYTISEYIRRKNFTSLIKAFSLEFDPLEPVELVIKTNGGDFENKLNAIYNGIKYYDNIQFYKKPIIISKRLNDHDLCALHQHADCYVSSSFGEAWGLGAMDAVGFGKTPIVPNSTGFKDYINNDIGWLVDTVSVSAYGAIDSLPELYTSEEQWDLVDVKSLKKTMREAYENKQLKSEKSARCISYIDKFSYQNVGNLILEALNVKKRKSN